MKLVLNKIGKAFNRQRVFHNLTYTFNPGGTYTVLGGNGSGKSTLIQILSYAVSPTKGSLTYFKQGKQLNASEIPFKIALAAPYFELIEELTAMEFLNFYQKFKPLKQGVSSKSLLEIAYLQDSANKEIRNFSSGMKQRLRLSLALLSSVDMLLLDEPTSNLDPEGINWYQSLIQDHLDNRTIVVGSNFDHNDMSFCTEQIELQDFK